MKENDKDIEQLIGKVMKEHVLQEPSFDFTSKVMARVTVQPKAVRYEPLISRAGWATIFGSIFATCIYMFSGTAPQPTQYDLDVSFLYNNKVSEALAGTHFSEAAMYAAMVVAFLVLIQIPLLKKHFGRKYIA